MVYIRVDANEIIGTGHAMRCLSIAKQIKDMGKDVTFLYADERTEKIIEEYGFKGICLNTIWNDLDQEIDLMIEMISKHNIKSLLIDSYFVTEMYLRKLKEYTKIAYVDDLHSMIFPVDLLINYNFYANSINYEKEYEKEGLSTKFVLGTQYAPLRKEFTEIKREVNCTLQKLLITSGGTDNLNAIESILNQLNKQVWFNELEYFVIMGRFNKNKEQLIEKWSHYNNIHLLESTPDIVKYMLDCDLAITAGGTTTYEICACGLPALLYTIADNQIQIAQTVSKDGIMPWIGDIRTQREQCMNNLVEQIKLYKINNDLRANISKKMQQVVDGKGCERLATILLDFNK